MSGQGRGGGLAGVAAEWWGREEGTGRGNGAKPLPQPVPGECEPAHRGHAEWGGGERETMVL